MVLDHELKPILFEITGPQGYKVTEKKSTELLKCNKITSKTYQIRKKVRNSRKKCYVSMASKIFLKVL
jgi:hypothetical protein